MATVIDFEDDLSIDMLEKSLNDAGKDDKWLIPLNAAAYAHVSQQTIEKLVKAKQYATKNNEIKELKIRESDGNVRAAISARSLIEWARADRRTAGFGSKKHREFGSLIVRQIPLARIEEFKTMLQGYNLVCLTPAEAAQLAKTKREAKAAAAAAKNNPA
jgi:hypothetical protein